MSKEVGTTKTLRMPRALWELFGEEPAVTDVLLITMTALGSAASYLLYFREAVFAWQWWQTILLILLVLDIAGGTVANLTTSTKKHYLGNNKKSLVFIAVHVQPLLLAFIDFSLLPALLFVWIFTAIASFIVVLNRARAFHIPLAVFFFVAGVSMLLSLFPLAPIFQIVLLLFIFKLVIAFAPDYRLLSI